MQQTFDGKTFGNTGRCVEVKKVRLYTPCFAGDYMEYIAGIRKQEGNKVLIEVRSFKIIEVPADPPYPSSIDVHGKSTIINSCTVLV